MAFAPPSTRCDIGYLDADNNMTWLAMNVDALEAQSYFFDPRRPKGTRFVCKIIK